MPPPAHDANPATLAAAVVRIAEKRIGAMVSPRAAKVKQATHDSRWNSLTRTTVLAGSGVVLSGAVRVKR